MSDRAQASRPVVVGVDDDTSATEPAIAWAVEHALVRHLPLRIVCAFDTYAGYLPTHLPARGYAPVPESDVHRLRAVAEQVVARAVSRACDMVGERGPIEVVGEAVQGAPVIVLGDESKHASTVVVGSRKLHAVGAVVLGSVGSGVAAASVCPVVVVRGPAGDPAAQPRVIVGVDAADPGHAALEFAFDYASRHLIPLTALLCWHPDALTTMAWRPQPAAEESAGVWLSESLAGWRERYPDVDLRADVRVDHPVNGLVAASHAQHLLVIGRRSKHAVVGTLLGAVSQGVLHSATLPVAVVPSS